MQTEISAEQQDLLNKLLTPFHPNDISWRVTNKSRDGKRGCVIPYADQRAYTDRLNLTVTPAGWTRTYSVATVSPVTRVKKNQAIQTGKSLSLALLPSLCWDHTQEPGKCGPMTRTR